MDYFGIIPKNVLNLVLSKLRITDLRRIEDYRAYRCGEPLGIFKEDVAKAIINLRYPQFWKLFNQSFSKKYSPGELTLFIELMEYDAASVESNLIFNIKNKENQYICDTGTTAPDGYLFDGYLLNRLSIRPAIDATIDMLSELFLMKNVPVLYSKIIKYGMGDIFSKRRSYSELINLCTKILVQRSDFALSFERYITEESVIEKPHNFYVNICSSDDIYGPAKTELLKFLFFVDFCMEGAFEVDIIVTFLEVFRASLGTDIAEILRLNPKYHRYINNEKFIFG